MSIKIHYSFVLYIFILFFLNLLPYYFIFFICILIHEITHIICGLFFEIKAKSININIGGISVDFDNINIVSNKKIIMFLSGPIMNGIMCLVTYILFKQKYLFFIITNFFLCIFNLLPIYPLDGGKVLLEISTKFLNYRIAVNIVRNIYNIFTITIFIVISYIYINYYNVQVLIIGAYILNFSQKNNYKNILII